MACEKRKQPRRHLIFYLKVVDPASGELIGHLVDITTVGMMIICKQPLETGREISIRLLLPEGFEDAADLDLVGETVWCHKDVNPDYYAAGFKFNPPASESAFIVQDLVDSFGFQD